MIIKKSRKFMLQKTVLLSMIFQRCFNAVGGSACRKNVKSPKKTARINNKHTKVVAPDPRWSSAKF